jgi:hypothetical protein
MSFDLRPLTLGELLDRAFTLYRRHFWLFVGLMALPSTITLLISVGLQLLSSFTPAAGSQGPDIDEAAVTRIIGFMAIFVVGFVVLMLAYWIAYMVALGATTVAVSEIYVGRPATVASSYGHMRGRIGRLLLLSLFVALRVFGIFLGLMSIVTVLSIGAAIAARPLGAIIVALGMIGSFVACGLYALRFAVSVPALVLEDVSAGAALRRSIALIRGNLGRTAVLVIFAMIITYAAMALFQGPFAVGAMMAGPESRTAFWLNLAGAVTGTLGGAVSGPLMIIALALHYYDVRIRKEGLDLDMMIASLGPDGPPPAPSTLTAAG